MHKFKYLLLLTFFISICSCSLFKSSKQVQAYNYVAPVVPPELLLKLKNQEKIVSYIESQISLNSGKLGAIELKCMQLFKGRGYSFAPATLEKYIDQWTDIRDDLIDLLNKRQTELISKENINTEIRVSLIEQMQSRDDDVREMLTTHSWEDFTGISAEIKRKTILNLKKLDARKSSLKMIISKKYGHLLD